MDRNKEIIRMSVYGIIVNVLLVAFKIFVGLLSNSIAIILDAVNNLSDAVSSIITIIGTKLASKPADKNHPFGYGRIEYLASVVIAVIILFTGFKALEESVIAIFNPSPSNYSTTTFVILVVSVLVKLIFGLYLKKVGSRLNAQSLEASGSDAVLDSFVSLATLVSALIYIFFNLNVDGYLGTIISILIVKTGFDILSESIGSIVGNRTESKLAKKIEETINSFDSVEGTFDLILHDYGPDEMIGAVHIEVNDQMTAREIDTLSREIAIKIYKEFGIILTIGIYASNTPSPKYLSIKDKIREVIKRNSNILQMHGFYIDPDTNTITFDIVLDFNTPNPKELVSNLKEELHSLFPTYTFYIFTDSDYAYNV